MAKRKTTTTTTPAQEFAALLKRHQLSHLQAAVMIGVSRQAVGSWLCPETDPRHRKMPKRHLEFLKFRLTGN